MARSRPIGEGRVVLSLTAKEAEETYRDLYYSWSAEIAADANAAGRALRALRAAIGSDRAHELRVEVNVATAGRVAHPLAVSDRLAAIGVAVSRANGNQKSGRTA